jgi:hypothetical protein
MKNYLSAIEQIMGISLETDLVRNYDFSPATVKGLRDFASGYSKIRISLPEDELKISCFLPFPEVLSGDFRTYHTSGSLSGHWPAFEDLANMLFICDRVIIHDHLEHYAGSAMDGYSADHRYDGLRNWLGALAEWKPLISRDIICIVPQDLALSGPLQSLWEEGTIHSAASEIYYEMYPDAGDFRTGYEAEELLAGFNEIEDLITTLSVPVNRGGKFAHFYNNTEMSGLHENLVNAVISLFRRKAFLAGDSNAFSGGPAKTGNFASFSLDAFLTASELKAADVCRLRLENEDFASVPGSVKNILRKFAENSSFLTNPSEGFQHFLDASSGELNRKLLKSIKSAPKVGQIKKKVIIGFAGMITGLNPEKYLTPEFSVIRSLLNNLPVKAQLPGSLCHYYLAIINKK